MAPSHSEFFALKAESDIDDSSFIAGLADLVIDDSIGKAGFSELEPNYPSSQWEVVQIMHGMILMLDPTQGPVLRRAVNEIYRHFAASTTVVAR